MTDRELLAELIQEIDREPFAVEFDEDDRLVGLFLNGCVLKKFPDSVLHMKNLLVLSFGETIRDENEELVQGYTRPGTNFIEFVPENIDALEKLEFLDLGTNQISYLPQSFSNLQNLRFLSLSRNQLSRYPEHINDLPNLNHLDIRFNKIIEIPLTISNLSKLNHLYLSSNNFNEIPPAIFELRALKTLHLSANNIKSFPSSFSQFSSLETLFIRYNRIEQLPENIFSKFKNLKTLNLSNNLLRTIPKAITNLNELSNLDLSVNKISAIPESLTNLQSLKRLNLSSNKITQVPQFFTGLDSLNQLSINGNPVSKLLEETFGTTEFFPLELKYLYEYLESDQLCPLNELKLLILGQGEVGKTSVIKRLLDDDFDPQEDTTQGINIQQWPLPGSDLVTNDTVRLNVWDFGGQEIMHATHQFFLTRRSVYLLVVNARKEEDIRLHTYWLDTIKSFGGDAPIIIIINKIDQHEYDLNRRALLDINPNIAGFVRFSSKTGEGRQELIDSINYVVDEHLAEARQPFPEKWLTIKRYLEALKQVDTDFIPFDDFLARCEQEELDEEQSRQLIELMHRLGVVISFHNDDRLNDTSIINPEWITTGVYTLLNAKSMAQSEGVLQRADIGKLLDKKRYPASRRRFIVEMMKKFELCYEFEEGNRLLIPDLFVQQEPRFDWDNERALRFRYRYSFLPSSIISRFIVRQHSRIDGELAWRNGVVLRDGESRAVIRAKQHENLLEIEISGDKQREFLEKIRFVLESLHDSFKGLQPDAEVPIPGSDQAIDYELLLEMEAEGEETHRVKGVGKVNVVDLLNGVTTEESRRFEKLTRMEWRHLFEAFNENEMRNLMYDFEVDHEDLAGATISERRREFMRLIERKGMHGDVLGHSDIQAALRKLGR